MSIEADLRHEGDGLVLWRRKNPSLEASSCEQGPYCVSAPSLTAEVVLSRAFGPPGRTWLLAVRKSSGEVAWTRTLESGGPIRTTADCVYYHGSEPIICLDATTGQMIWRTARELRPISRPTISLERAYFWSSRSRLFQRELQVSCVDATSGAFLWSTRRSHSIPHPLIVSDARVIGSEHGAIFALDAFDGRVLWEHAIDSALPRALVAGCQGVLVRFKDDRIRLLRAADGSPAAEWSWPGKLAGDIAGTANEAFAVRSIPVNAIAGDRHLTMPGDSEVVQLRADGSSGWVVEMTPGVRRIRWDTENGLLVEALGDALGLVDPAVGRRRHLISMAKDECFHRPTVEGGRAYLTTVLGGEIICLKLPIDAHVA